MRPDPRGCAAETPWAGEGRKGAGLTLATGFSQSNVRLDSPATKKPCSETLTPRTGRPHHGAASPRGMSVSASCGGRCLLHAVLLTPGLRPSGQSSETRLVLADQKNMPNPAWLSECLEMTYVMSSHSTDRSSRTARPPLGRSHTHFCTVTYSSTWVTEGRDLLRQGPGLGKGRAASAAVPGTGQAGRSRLPAVPSPQVQSQLQLQTGSESREASAPGPRLPSCPPHGVPPLSASRSLPHASSWSLALPSTHTTTSIHADTPAPQMGEPDWAGWTPPRMDRRYWAEPVCGPMR